MVRGGYLHYGFLPTTHSINNRKEGSLKLVIEEVLKKLRCGEVGGIDPKELLNICDMALKGSPELDNPSREFSIGFFNILHDLTKHEGVGIFGTKYTKSFTLFIALTVICNLGEKAFNIESKQTVNRDTVRDFDQQVCREWLQGQNFVNIKLESINFKYFENVVLSINKSDNEVVFKYNNKSISYITPLIFKSGVNGDGQSRPVDNDSKE